MEVESTNQVAAGSQPRYRPICPITFRSAWRPALGWVCVLATAWNYVLAPTIVAAAELMGRPMSLDLVQDEVLFELLATTLGIGGMRMIEKLKDVASG